MGEGNPTPPVARYPVVTFCESCARTRNLNDGFRQLVITTDALDEHGKCQVYAIEAKLRGKIKVIFDEDFDGDFAATQQVLTLKKEWFREGFVYFFQRRRIGNSAPSLESLKRW
jgi:hypothetical protein